MIDRNWSDKVILIAEDEQINFVFLKAVFKHTGATILEAKNGREAIEICMDQDHDIDIVLMDIKMPDIDGLEATREIKKVNPELYVIAQTAYTFKEDQERAEEAGCDDFLAKPIRPVNLLAIVDKYL
mgnify:FL=1|jgi:CheY-like chemotaxis protein